MSTSKTTNFSVFDLLEVAHLSLQELDEKFLEMQKMLLKIKRKNQDSEKPRAILCVKIEIFDYFLKKLDSMLQTFHSMSSQYEEIISMLNIKLSESGLEAERTIRDLQNQHKCDLMRLELNYNKLMESQSLSFGKKEKEMIETYAMISRDLDKTFKGCKTDLEETSMNFQDLKQTRLNNKAKHLFSLNEFEKNLKASIKKIEESRRNLPLKLKTMSKTDESVKKIRQKPDLLKNFSSNPEIDRNRLIHIKEKFYKNLTRSKNPEKTQAFLEQNRNNDSGESEISVFLANQLNIFHEESRLNISMPKDEGKWDPALDSEKEENNEYSEIRKAFEIFDNLSLFESENLNILQKFSEKCKENKNLIDKSIFKELILQLLKLQKERKSKILNATMLPSKASPHKNSSPNSAFHELPPIIDDTNLNMTQIENIDAVNDTDESKNPLDLKPEPFIRKSPKERDDFLKKVIKNKDLSLSDLILDSSFLSPTGSKLRAEEICLKNLRKDENGDKSMMILIEEVSSNKRSLENSPSSQNFQRTMITNKASEGSRSHNELYQEEDAEQRKYDALLSQMKEEIRKEKEKLSLSQKEQQVSFRSRNPNAAKSQTNFLSSDLKFELSGKVAPREAKKISMHCKHNSEIFRSTPNASFLNNLNSNSETKLSNHIDQNSLNGKLPAKYRNNSISCLGTQKTASQTNHFFQRILKKTPPFHSNNSIYFSNQSRTKLTTAEFNKEIGFLQNVVYFGTINHSTCRSEPIILPLSQSACNNFSKILNNNKENSKIHDFNCSFPGCKRENKRKRQILVKDFGNENGNKKKSRFINASLEMNEGWEIQKEKIKNNMLKF